VAPVRPLAPPARPRPTPSAIDTIEGTVDRTRRANGYEVLKLKVGGADDLERLRAVRENTSARIRIDGNEGWTLETARELMPVPRWRWEWSSWSSRSPRDDIDSSRAACARSRPRIPVIIDEGLQGPCSTWRGWPATPTD